MTESVHQQTIPLELVRQALPVSTAASLLSCIADSWLKASEARACHVSLIVGHHLESVFVETDCVSDPLRSTTAFPEPPAAWSAALASESLATMAGDRSSALKSVTVVPFPIERVNVGGVLLLGSIQDSETLSSLAETTALLIEQLRRGTAAQPESTPVPETRLRDLKLEAMAEFAAGAGHEINNPVATIAGRSALLLKTETDPERRRALETIGGQAYRIRDMIGDAMTFARPPEPVPEEFEPAADILQIAQNLQQQFSGKQVSVETHIDDSVRLNADREQFRAVVSCLIKNSLEAIEDDGVIRIELDRVTATSEEGSLPTPERVRFAVSDNGVGLSETEREHLFDPFYSGRQAGRGLGFGLSKCWQILRLHGGTVEAFESSIENASNGLTIVSLWPA